jgi:hypothetical protein
MIKRSGAVVLTLLYIVTAMGFAINLHYCCSHLASIKIDAPVKSCNMPVTGKMKCCQDKHLEVKVKDAHQGQSQSFLSKIFGFELPKLPFADFFFSAQQTLSDKDLDKDPPDPPSNGLINFLKNCVFRI